VKKITGIILAGGKSSRMGTDKALIEVNGKKIIQHIFEALNNVTDSVMIISNSNNADFLGVSVYTDLIEDCGPLGGIYTGLKFSETEKNIILSCDIPFVTAELLNFLIEKSEKHDVAIPEHNGKTEPLCGVYSKSCEQVFKNSLTSGNHKLHDAINLLNLNIVNIDKEKFYNNKLLANLNTLEELKKYTELNHDN